MEGNKELIYIENREFLTLLNCAGVDSWYGPDFCDDEIIENDRDMNRIIASLYRKQFLEWEGSDAVIAGEMDEAVRIIQKACVCILACGKNSGADLSYYYPLKEKIVGINVSERDADSFRIAVMTFDEWILQLEEEGFFPEQISRMPGKPQLIYDDADSVMELHDIKTGEILKQIHIVDNGGYGIICVTEPEHQDFSICSRDEYRRILRQWTEVCRG